MRSKTHSQVCPNFFEESNGCVFIDDALLTPATKNIVLVLIAGTFFVLLYSGSSPILENPAFVLDLFHPHHAPNSNFWNKLTSPIECTDVINAFLMSA